MKKKALFFIALPILLNAQSSTVPQEQSRVNAMNELMKSNTSSLMLYYRGSEVDIKGSRYFYNEYVDGEVWFIDNKVIDNEYLYKYDESLNSVQVKNKKTGEEILVDWEKIYGCKLKIKDKFVIYFRAEVPNSPNKFSLFQLVYYSDSYQAFKLPFKQLVTRTKYFHNDDTQYEYIDRHRYFIKKGDGKIKEISLKKKSILNAFPEKKTFLTKLFDTPQYNERLHDSDLANILATLDKNNQ